MLPKTMPLPGGRGWRMSPVRTPQWSPCPFTSTLRPMVRSGKRLAGASDCAAPVGRLEHLEALVGEHAAQRVPDVLLVVHHQDRLGHPSPPPRRYAPAYAPCWARTASCAARRRTGNSRTKRLPRGRLSRTRINPLWSATIADTIASPRPVPSGLVEK